MGIRIVDNRETIRSKTFADVKPGQHCVSKATGWEWLAIVPDGSVLGERRNAVNIKGGKPWEAGWLPGDLLVTIVGDPDNATKLAAFGDLPRGTVFKHPDYPDTYMATRPASAIDGVPAWNAVNLTTGLYACFSASKEVEIVIGELTITRAD